MCGIAGILNRDGAPVNPDILVRMTRTMAHRGPDEEGYYVNAGKIGGLEVDGLQGKLRVGVERRR